MYVTPEISGEEANHLLSHKISFLPVRTWKKPISPRRIELIYLPFYLFEVELTGEGKKQKVTVSLDGLIGSTLFFAKDNMNFKTMVDNPVCNFILSKSEAKKAAMEEYKWLLLEHGLRNKKASTVNKILEVKKIYYPFWVGYIKKRQVYDFKALDGVSGEIQGVKMRKVFLKAFRQVSPIQDVPF